MTKNTNETFTEHILPQYYTVDDIRIILRLGRSRTYRLLEKAYETKEPFVVRKICNMYRIEKESFDNWLNAQ